uniref:Uncharacterized protein n=1 Tax=Lotharella oceanica TaxID=641309 RepID=A0A7S2TPC8_9EUKA|mmetsp:Transcript_23683/g.44246  ORF Transcript_23683/g.44246 Transcript_23683/m.44246 type:complete len:179 (+) Transcript_23683:105-641(+)
MDKNAGENDFTLVMIGDAGVGKTALLLRFADDQFLGDYMPTVGVDFRYRKFDVDGKRVKLQIWDTAGQERFRTMTASYYRGAHGVVLVYDITNRESFEHVQGWMKSVDKYGREGVIRMVIGNKCDRESERQVHHCVTFFVSLQSIFILSQRGSYFVHGSWSAWLPAGSKGKPGSVCRE